MYLNKNTIHPWAQLSTTCKPHKLSHSPSHLPSKSRPRSHHDIASSNLQNNFAEPRNSSVPICLSSTYINIVNSYIVNSYMYMYTFFKHLKGGTCMTKHAYIRKQSIQTQSPPIYLFILSLTSIPNVRTRGSLWIFGSFSSGWLIGHEVHDKGMGGLFIPICTPFGAYLSRRMAAVAARKNALMLPGQKAIACWQSRITCR